MTIQEIAKITKKINILYVEDDTQLRASTLPVFSKIFKSVDVAVDGQDGLEKFQQKKYDIIVTDITMPRKDGLSMIKDILRINKEQKIVVASGYDESRFLVPLINLGIHAFHVKPYDTKAFIFSLYKESRDILIDRKTKVMEKQQAVFDEKLTKKRDKAIEMNERLNKTTSELSEILKSVHTAVMVVHHGEVSYANEAAFKLMNLNSLHDIQTFTQQLSTKLVDGGVDYIVAEDLEQLVFKTQDTQDNKIILQLESGVKYISLSCKTLDEDKYVLSLSDITQMEQREFYNPVTNLGNIKYLTENLDEYLEKNRELLVFLIKLTNYNGIKKWLGPDGVVEAEKKFSAVLNDEFENLDLKEKGLLANLGINQFVIITKPEYLEELEKPLYSLEKEVIIKYKESSQDYNEFSLSAKYEVLFLTVESKNALIESIQAGLEKFSQ